MTASTLETTGLAAEPVGELERFKRDLPELFPDMKPTDRARAIEAKRADIERRREERESLRLVPTPEPAATIVPVDTPTPDAAPTPEPDQEPAATRGWLKFHSDELMLIVTASDLRGLDVRLLLLLIRYWTGYPREHMPTRYKLAGALKTSTRNITRSVDRLKAGSWLTLYIGAPRSTWCAPGAKLPKIRTDSSEAPKAKRKNVYRCTGGEK